MTGESLTAAEVWLRAEGVSRKKAHQFRLFDPVAVASEWRAEIPPKGAVADRERQKRIGGLLDRWEVRPPQVPPPARPRAPLPFEQALLQARELLPDAGAGELERLAADLAEGVDPEQALASLQQHRAFQQLWGGREA